MRYAADETRQFPVSLHRIVPKRLGYRWQWVVGTTHETICHSPLGLHHYSSDSSTTTAPMMPRPALAPDPKIGLISTHSCITLCYFGVILARRGRSGLATSADTANSL